MRKHVLADLDGRVDLILDSGPTAIGLESTVLDLTTSTPRLLRPGPVSIGELEAVLGESIMANVAASPGNRLSSPGLMPVHYAPMTPAFRVDQPGSLERIGDREDTALVVFGDHERFSHSRFAARHHLESPVEASRQLYDVLHKCDSMGMRAILVLMPPDEPEWRAVRDRLLRATRPLGDSD